MCVDYKCRELSNVNIHESVHLYTSTPIQNESHLYLGKGSLTVEYPAEMHEDVIGSDLRLSRFAASHAAAAAATASAATATASTASAATATAACLAPRRSRGLPATAALRRALVAAEAVAALHSVAVCQRKVVLGA